MLRIHLSECRKIDLINDLHTKTGMVILLVCIRVQENNHFIHCFLSILAQFYYALYIVLRIISKIANICSMIYILNKPVGAFRMYNYVLYSFFCSMITN